MVTTRKLQVFGHRFRSEALFLLALIGFLALIQPPRASAQQVSARLSTNRTFVGAPVVLELRINNASDFTAPDGFEIGGCDVQPAGAPSRSSQIFITNGRRSERHSAAFRYSIVPRRPGTFEIPALSITVDGKLLTTQPRTFTAEESETGDLLYVEVEGSADSVYVGQPLGLRLKIWMRPFRETNSNVKLNASQMWQMLSSDTSWGAFEDRLQQLANQRVRPAAETRLRDNEQGQRRDYFVYEIDTTVYPTKPGKIDASDLQIVVNYPVAISRSHDPFESIISRNSPLQRLLNDDVFGGSPFGNRLAITQSRPIAASATVDSTEVLPVPTLGKPDDYRGAVGQYKIITQAAAQSVDAGDPVTLRIGVIGDGPMDLVQAPPLAEIDALTRDFQVVDRSLAGFVENDKKVFETTIRPRSAAVQEIPAIPFSFFDPQSQSYRTVYSKSIPLTVNESQTLSLDAIRGGATAETSPESTDQDIAIQSGDFANLYSDTLLNPSARTTAFPWKYFVTVPAVLFGFLAVGKFGFGLLALTGWLKSPQTIAQTKIQQADTKDAIGQAIVDFISQRTWTDNANDQQAIGVLRMAGLRDIANQTVDFLDRLSQPQSASVLSGSLSQDPSSIHDDRKMASQLVEQLDQALLTSDSVRIRSKRQQATRDKSSPLKTGASTLVVLFLLGGSAAAAAEGRCEQSLGQRQLKTLLTEAGQAYQDGESAGDDRAIAKTAFLNAATKYQLVVDAGVRNADLYVNLGNARFRAGQISLAIADYHRAVRLEPANPRGRRQLAYAQRRLAEIQSVAKPESSADKVLNGQTPNTSRPSLDTLRVGLNEVLGWTLDRLGSGSVAVFFAIVSILFWSLLAIGLVAGRKRLFVWAVLPFGAALLSGAVLLAGRAQQRPIAILVADEIPLHSADGTEFPVVASLDNLQGTAVNVLQHRSGWLEIQSDNHQTGWLNSSFVQIVDF